MKTENWEQDDSNRLLAQCASIGNNTVCISCHFCKQLTNDMNIISTHKMKWKGQSIDP